MLEVYRRYMLDKEVAEDLVHNAFLAATNKYKSYTGKGCFGAWPRNYISGSLFSVAS